jgi:glycosyltransferase involved in cell wall biosynthesis
MLKILLLSDRFHANSINFIDALEKTKLVELEFLTFDFKQSEKTSRFYFLKRIFAFLFIFLRIRFKIHTFRPDLILGYRTTSYGFIATRFNRHAKIVIAMQGVSDIFPHSNWSAPWKRRLQQNAFRRASLIQAWGKTQQQYALMNGADPNKIFIKPRGIDLDCFEFGNQFRDVEIINWIVSRSLSKDYNHELLINSFAMFLNNCNGHHHLFIVGEGPLLVELIKLVRALSISDHVTFVGRVSNLELSKLLRKSHFYVSLPITEGVSASLLEAMACGCIPLVSDLPSNREWINHRKNGILTKIDSQSIIVEHFNFLYKNMDLFVKARIQNRQIVEKLGNQKLNTLSFVNQYKNLFIF